MLYIVAYLVLLLLMVGGVLALRRYIKALDVRHAIELKSRLTRPHIDAGFTVKLAYTSLKASSGVLEAHYHGLAFGIADSMYEAGEAILARLRHNHVGMSPTTMYQVLKELRFGNK